VGASRRCFADLFLDVFGDGETLGVSKGECDPAAEWNAELVGLREVDLVLLNWGADDEGRAFASGSGPRLSSLFLVHSSFLARYGFGIRIKSRVRVSSLVEVLISGIGMKKTPDRT
jgi:hypothetical protein